MCWKLLCKIGFALVVSTTPAFANGGGLTDVPVKKLYFVEENLIEIEAEFDPIYWQVSLAGGQYPVLRLKLSNLSSTEPIELSAENDFIAAWMRGTSEPQEAILLSQETIDEGGFPFALPATRDAERAFTYPTVIEPGSVYWIYVRFPLEAISDPADYPGSFLYHIDSLDADISLSVVPTAAGL